MEQHDKVTPDAAIIDEYRRQMMELYRQQSPTPSPAATPQRDAPRVAEAVTPAISASPIREAGPLPDIPDLSAPTIGPPAEAEREDNWLESRFPLPDFERDRAALLKDTPAAEVSPDPPQSIPEDPPQPAVPTFPYTDEDLNGQPPYPQEPTDPPAIAESPFVGYLRVFVFTGGGAEPLEGARVVVSRQEGEAEVIYANTETDRDGYTPVIPLPSVNPELTLRPDVVNPFVAYTIQVNADGFSAARHENVPVYGNNYVTQPVALVPLLPGEDPDAIRRFYSNGPADL